MCHLVRSAGAAVMDKGAKRLNKLVKKAHSHGRMPDPMGTVVVRCTWNKMQTVMDNV